MLNIEENITRKTDLVNEDSLSAFKNHASQQSHNAYRVFYEFLAEVKPSQILEIGTGLGGFTSFLKICCDDLELSTSILSFDIHEKSWFSNNCIVSFIELIRLILIKVQPATFFSRKCRFYNNF